MIPEIVIQKQIGDFNEDFCSEWNHKNGFVAGVKFTENYLKDLSIEFAEWLDDNKWFRTQNTLDEKYWIRNFVSGTWNDKAKNTNELFGIFLKQRNND